ncbi:hypothetical protein [Halobaculum litoreum]|uniref:Uncharacterized protein n=1 Tax=Halobaculum litoreum TaxID=3031998 RepID=A0ABD5XML5_9EURY|nr:hypothetical protein [Halobaculum sp. DT92]
MDSNSLPMAPDLGAFPRIVGAVVLAIFVGAVAFLALAVAAGVLAA